MLKSAKRACLVLGLAVLGLPGCFARQGKFAFNGTSIGHYERMAAAIEYPDVVSQTARDVIAPPLMLSMDGEPAYWDLTLEDAVHLALVNSRVLRDLGGIALRSP